MNKKDQLLTDTLRETSVEDYARHAAAYARRRRRAKQALGTTSAVLTLIAIGFAVDRPAPRPAQSPRPAALSATFETISDQELITQLKGQSVILMKGRSGINEVVFLADKKFHSPVSQ